MKRVLLVAFHFPPYRGGSGIHRTLKITRYLSENGWLPLVLTASPTAYTDRGDDELQEIPGDTPVVRAFALDAARHLSMKGRYLGWTAVPDRWATWWLGAVLAGLRMIRKHRPDAIWSTSPIATAHGIALTLSRLTGLPWVADFRDPMTEEHYPQNPTEWRVRRRVERLTVQRSRRVVFTTESTRRMYAGRYPEVPSHRFLVIPNGYDEEDFSALAADDRPPSTARRPIRLLHAGLLYPQERDPRPFFQAVASLKRQGALSADVATIDLRASGAEHVYEVLIRELAIGDVVRLLPPLPHREALRDASRADALLLFQAATCNHQIPAKVYEYLRLGRPILALTDQAGDTAALLKATGGATIIDLADADAIRAGLPAFVQQVQTGAHPSVSLSVAQRFSRRSQVRDLAECLGAVTSPVLDTEG